MRRRRDVGAVKTKMKLLVVMVLSVVSASLARADAPPRLRDERIVLQTTLGDVTLALYDDSVAPLTAAHVLALFDAGAYATNHFFRVDKGFVAQIADCAGGRRATMNAEQRALATATVKGEFSTTLRHARGTLSMARWDDVDSAMSSFSIMLGDAAHLDGKYAIFGEMVDGEETLRRMEAVETKKEGMFVMPVERIEVEATYVVRPKKQSRTESTDATLREELDECRARADSLALELHEIREKRLPGN